MPRISDTAPAIELMVREKIMARSGEERFLMGAQMFDSAMEMAKASLPPGLPIGDRRRRLFKHIYGKELDLWD
jgi:hypothetical protein